MPTPCICLATSDSRCRFKAIRAERHAPGPSDVVIDVKFCGVCHSDVHLAKNDFLISKYPCVPGHEMAGVVAAVGAKVTAVALGDHVGVGCFVDSCLNCKYCEAGNEHMCAKGETLSYNDPPKHGRAGEAPYTLGGYTTKMVVHERFVVPAPKDYPLDKLGPLLCAGITTYSPLVRFGAGPGVRVGVSGLGGLGTMAVKQAKAMGAEVTVISRSRRKEAYARSIGADHLVVSADRASLAAAGRSLDLVIDTVNAYHDIGANMLAGGIKIGGMDSAGTLLDLLDLDGTWVYLGASLTMINLQPPKLALQQARITGSKIGGIRMQRECVQFCADNKIEPEVVVQPATPAALANIYELLDAGNDAGARHVLDIGSTLTEASLGEPIGPAPQFHSGAVHMALELMFLMHRALLAKVEEAVLTRSGAIARVLQIGAVAAVGGSAALAWKHLVSARSSHS